MKYALLLFTILASTFKTIAQEPAWLDAVSRTSNWPQEQYLTAFATEVVGKNQSESDAQTKLNEIVKSQLSDAIMVSINAQTELDITVENAATDQKLNRKSASSSDVDLVGLKLDNYFDKRKKTMYAYAYVLIEDLAKYNRELISNNTDQINNNLNKISSTQNKTTQIEWLVENKVLLKAIQKSIRLLTALSIPNVADLAILKTTAERNNRQLEELFEIGTITLSNLVTRIAGELLLQLPTGSTAQLTTGQISFSNSGNTSSFSEALSNQLKTVLSTDSRISFAEEAKGKVGGTFDQNESTTRYNINLSDGDGRYLSAIEIPVTTSVINTNGLSLLPPNFQEIPNLSKLKLSAPADFTVKPSQYVNKPLTITSLLPDRPLANLNVIVSLEKDGKEEPYKALSDESGRVAFVFDESMVVPGQEYLARVYIDLPSYLNLSNENPFLLTLKSNQTLPESTIAIDIIAPSIFIDSKEEGLDGALGVKVLEPAVKGGLSQLNYAFTDDVAKADYKLTIEAVARKGQIGDLATLTYVDATVSLINQETGKEIYKNSFFNIKGIGASHNDAQSKAYQKARNQIVDDITYELEYNR
ncbi:MAG: hypothetical protein ACJAZM_000386 [Cyclobacteriaceae bacterium]|jgi:hypothetical protein